MHAPSGAFDTQPSAPNLSVSAPVVVLRSKIASELLARALRYALRPSGETTSFADAAVSTSKTPELTTQRAWMSPTLATQVEPVVDSVPVVVSRGKAVTMPVLKAPWMSATAYTVLPSGLTVTAPTW